MGAMKICATEVDQDMNMVPGRYKVCPTRFECTNQNLTTSTSNSINMSTTVSSDGPTTSFPEGTEYILVYIHPL